MLRYRYLFEQMVRRELRQKYKGSVLGVLWYLVNPLILMGAYTLMFSVLLGAFPGIEDYPLFLLVGLIVWLFFSQSLLSASTSLIEQSSLVGKVAFPRETIPASVVAVQLITFGVLLVLVGAVCLIVRGTVDPALLLLPLVVAALAAFTYGLALVVSVLNAYYRDVYPILAAALLPWFFLSPIFFDVDELRGVRSHPWAGHLLEWLNPVAPFIEAARSILYDGRVPQLDVLGYVVAAGVLALAAGTALFRRMDAELAVIL
jgi:ABC-type polysaccharide/polyol phosphate export permease